MNYIQNLTVPPNTKPYTPVRITVNPIVSKVKSVRLDYPAGTLNTTGVRILERGKQIYPYPSGYKFGNDESVNANLNWKMEGPPFEITIEGYSVAVDWSHTITIDLECEK